MSRVYGRPAGINAKDLDTFMQAYQEVRYSKDQKNNSVVKRVAARLLGTTDPIP